MGKKTAIVWTNHTFNPWWGCTKISPACLNCYAATWSKRVGKDFWGDDKPRRFFSDSHWAEPLKWDVDARNRRCRERVFCASMGDVFEDREDLSGPRARLWKLILNTPSLDWLLVTKRIENVAAMVPWTRKWPPNVWLGVTVENQVMAEARMPQLIRLPAKVRFVSCEPLLGDIDLQPWLGQLHWVIAGGESGMKARPMNIEWARSLRDMCKRNEVSFFFKQWGTWAPDQQGLLFASQANIHNRHLDGEVWNEYPNK